MPGMQREKVGIAGLRIQDHAAVSLVHVSICQLVLLESIVDCYMSQIRTNLTEKAADLRDVVDRILYDGCMSFDSLMEDTNKEERQHILDVIGDIEERLDKLTRYADKTWLKALKAWEKLVP